ncbi:hypothetical protein EON67_00400 [archaeon]|nr:MAG: hypothetical protein EON67_00400 [archaeon]
MAQITRVRDVVLPLCCTPSPHNTRACTTRARALRLPRRAGAMVGIVVGVTIATYIAYRLLKRIVVVNHSQVMIIERWGKADRILRPGWHWLWPIIDAPRLINWRYLDCRFDAANASVVSITTDRVDMREHLIDLGEQTVITVRAPARLHPRPCVPHRVRMHACLCVCVCSATRCNSTWTRSCTSGLWTRCAPCTKCKTCPTLWSCSRSPHCATSLPA